jgi:AraC-like DNA-binding protein
MNPVLEYLPPNSEESFFAQMFELPYFGTPWHYHPEYELVYVAESSGKRFIGNAVSDFQEGDLSLLGPNLPHLYRNDPAYYTPHSSLKARSVVIHFRETAIGQDLLALPQAGSIRKLLARSRKGLDIRGKTKEAVTAILYELLNARGMKRLILLLDILNILSESKDCKTITAIEIVGNNSMDTERLSVVFDHILRNFHQPIKLEDVARLVHMTPTSFCRFFKERTKRSFSSYLINVRLDHAKKRLIEGKSPIEQICYDSGYNNLSNFNRQFKEHASISPREYRQLYANYHGGAV